MNFKEEKRLRKKYYISCCSLRRCEREKWSKRRGRERNVIKEKEREKVDKIIKETERIKVSARER